MLTSEATCRVILRAKPGSGPMEMHILNHRFQTVASGFEKIDTHLPAGLYRLDINAGGVQKNEFFSLEPGKDLKRLDIDVPFPSAAPVPGTSTTHKLHENPVSRLSRHPKYGYGEGGRLVLFFRNVGKELQVPFVVDGFILMNSSFQRVGNFTQDVERHTEEGWVAWSADLEPGGYALRRQSNPEQNWGKERFESKVVDFSIWVSEGWTTLVFIPNSGADSIPDLQFASINMVQKGSDYLDEHEINLALEAALHGLRQGRAAISDDMLDSLLRGKFQNPMLGIVGAHMLLLAQEPNWNLFNTVVRNLNRLVRNHPDVTALRVVGGERQGDPAWRNQQTPVTWPPMLYASYRGLIAGDSKDPGLIENGSVADRAAASLLQQGPWCMWQPIRRFENTSETYESFDASENLKEVEQWIKELRHPLIENVSVPELESWTPSGSLGDLEVQQVAEYLVWVERRRSRRNDMAGQRLLKVEELSKNVGLPVSSVKRAIQTIAEQKSFYALDDVDLIEPNLE